MFITVTLIPETFEEVQKKIQKIVKEEQAYVYSTDNENHAKELSVHRTKYFKTKTKNKEKAKQDISHKILYGDDQGVHCSDIENKSSLTCTLISLFYFNCFKAFLLYINFTFFLFCCS